MAKKKAQTIELKKIAKELGIDVPILNTKISGNKLILYLYGGRVVEYPLQPAEPEPGPSQETLRMQRTRGASPEAKAPDPSQSSGCKEREAAEPKQNKKK